LALCDWCVNGVCRAGDEATCDFKNLPMEKDAIIKRIDDEWDVVKLKFAEVKKIKEVTDDIQLLTLVNESKDKLEGIKIMREVLLDKFKKNYFPEKNVFSFMKLIAEVNKHMKKLKQKEQSKRMVHEKRKGK